jgi:hypothetical protein
MLLVPRQLRRYGMTGSVPYYGGRFTPAQAYAAAHPSQAPPAGLASPLGPPAATGRTLPPAPGRAPRPGRPARPSGPHSPAEQLAALQQLAESGVLTETEYAQLRERVT